MKPTLTSRRRLLAVLTLTFGLGLPLAQAAPPADFTVEAPADGAKFRLSEAKGKYVVLHFLLKTECPVCLRHTREYARKAATLPDAMQVFLKPDSAEEIRKWTAKAAEDPVKPITVYRDADATLAKAFEIPDGYAFHGQTVHYPALVILDPAGKEVFRYVGKSNTDRFGFDLLSAKVAELKAKAAGSGAAQPK